MNTLPNQPQSRCLAQVCRLSRELQWNLSAAEAESLASRVLSYVSADISDVKLAQTITAYVEDHELVDSLRYSDHPRHREAWELWHKQVAAILGHANLLWSRDYAIDADDLVQIACTELAQALPRFRYASRFSTWARTVVVQRIQRHVRDSMAIKRAQRPESLDSEAVDASALLDDAEPVEVQVETADLYRMIDALLADHPEQRLQTIYRLWIQQDQRIEDIGALMHVHPSRVRQLIGQMRHFLREHPDLQEWLDERFEPKTVRH
jgi:RNA polymerase sigma factor (sigma-70 family)